MPTAYGAPLPIASPAPSEGLGDTETAPSAPEAAQSVPRVNHERLRKMFGTGDDFYSVFGEEQAQGVRGQLESRADGGAMRQRVANTAFLADKTGLTARDIADRYDTVRNTYARQMFPDRLGPDGTMEDGVFFTNVSRMLQAEADEAQKMGEWNASLFEAAVQGQDFASAFEGVRNTGTVPSDKRRLDIANAWMADRWEKNRTAVAKLSPIIDQAADLFSAMRSKEGTGTEEFVRQRQTVVEAMAGLDPEEQSTVWAMAGRRATETPQSERGAVNKVFGTLSMGTNDLIDSAIMGLASTLEAVAPVAMIPVQTDVRRMEVDRTLTRIASGEIDPIKADSFAGQVALDFVRSVPMTLAALTPAGLAVDFFALKQNARDNLQAQGITGNQAEAVATVQAIPQTALFFATSKMVFLGKTPKAFGASIPATLSVEYLGNLALNEAGYLTDAGIQQVAAQLSDAIPDVDWQKFGMDFRDRLPQSLALAIPGALIGTGVSAFKNRPAGTKYMQDPAVMDELGFTPEAKAAVLEAGDDFDATAEAFREGYESRTPPPPVPLREIPAGTQFTLQVPEAMEIMPGRTAKIPGFVQVDFFEAGTEGPGIVSGGTRRNVRSTNLETLRSEGYDVPPIPADLPKGKYTIEQLREEVAARGEEFDRFPIAAEGVIPFGAAAEPIRRNADGTYTVRAVPGAPAVLASTPEGAAMVQREQLTEAAQQAATAAPEPRPEQDGRALPTRITALNKQEITALRALFNMDELDAPTRERFQQVLDEAKRTESHKGALGLANDLIATKRVSSASEHAALVMESVRLQNQYEQVAAQIGDAYARGDADGAVGLRRTADGILAELDTITEASDVSGTAIARALSIRRMRINRNDYTLARLVQRATEGKRAALTPEQQSSLKAITDDLIEQQRVIAEQKNRLAEQDLELARNKAESFVAEGRSRRRAATAKDAAARRAGLKKELLALGMRVNDITSIIGNNVELARLVAKIADTYIEEGVASLAELTNKLKADIPDLSDQDIFLAVGRQTKAEAKKIANEAQRRVRELRSQAALWAKINAALEGKREGGTPLNRQQQNRLLRESLTELRQQANRTIFDDAALKRVDAKIAEIQTHLANATRPAAKPEGAQPSEKLSAARQTLSELRQEMGALDTIAELERVLAEAEPKPAQPGQAPEPKPTPTEQQAKLNAMRERIAELRDQIDQAQVDPAAVNAERLAKLQSLSADLEAQLEGGFREIKSQAQRGGVADADDVAAARRQLRELERLMRTEDSIADLTEQLRTGEFKVSAPEQRILTNAKLEQALIRERQIKRKIDDTIEGMRSKTAIERGVEFIQTARTLNTVGDIGTTLRQLVLVTARGVISPKRAKAAANAWVSGFRSLFSENDFDAIQLAIERHPDYLEAVKAQVFLADVTAGPNAREEMIQSNLADRIPGWGRVVRGSGRAMTASLNVMRMSVFSQFVRAHPESTAQQRKNFAWYLNAATGRGNVKWGPNVAKALNTAFFAPRYAVSRFQAIYAPLKFWNDPLTRNEALKDWGAFIGTGAMVLWLAQMAGAEVSLDPSESDFGKIVIGDTRIDIWGGLQQPVRLILQALLSAPQEREAIELENDINLKDAAGSFLWYKLSPAFHVPYALATGENAIGQEQTALETVIRSVTPLTGQEAFDVGTENESLPAGIAAFMAGFNGIGVQQHGRN